MQIKIGDRVRFLNDVGGGKVTSLINKDMVNVETEDGFEVPSMIRNLVVISTPDTYSTSGASPKRKRTERQEQTEAEERHEEEPSFKGFVDINQKAGNTEPDFRLAFVPTDDKNPLQGGMGVFLVNNCNHTLLYQFAHRKGTNYETMDTGTLEPNTKIELETLTQADISELPSFCFQLIFFTKKSDHLNNPVQKEVTVNPVKFYKEKSFVETDFFRQRSIIYSLVEDPLTAELEQLSEKDFKKIAREKERPAKKKMTKVNLTGLDIREIDLHINELLDDIRGLSNTEMLKIQMETFQKELQDAIKAGVKKIVFIHGIGNGTLKNELRRELQRKYKKYDMQDASFEEYGFGATMVILRK